MNPPYNLKILSLFFCLLALSACNQIGLKKPEEQKPEQDLFDIQAEADEAYQKDEFALAEEKYEVLHPPKFSHRY